jgi:hypothetical protein
VTYFSDEVDFRILLEKIPGFEGGKKIVKKIITKNQIVRLNLTQ